MKHLLPREWKNSTLACLAEKQKRKNLDFKYTLVLSNSARCGIVPQTEQFDKEIASQERIDSYYVVPNHAFVYNPRISASAPCGPISMNETGRIGVMSPLYTVFTINPTKVNRIFLKYYFQSALWHRHMKSVANYGARHDRMSICDEDFFLMPVPLPSTREQEVIASILYAQERIIDLKEKLLAEKKKRKKYLMQQLLTGRVRFPGFSTRPMKKTALGLIPKDWRIMHLGKVGEFYKGFGISKNEISKQGRPCIRYAEIYTQYQEVVWTVKSKAPDSSCKVLGGCGDVIFACSGETVEEIGKCVAYLGEQRIGIGGDSCVFTAHGQNPCFLSYMLNSTICQLQKARQATGSSIVHLHVPQLEKVYVTLPSLREQEAIAGALLAADREIDLLSQAIEKEKQKKKALMQLLLTGIVRV